MWKCYIAYCEKLDFAYAFVAVMTAANEQVKSNAQISKKYFQISWPQLFIFEQERYIDKKKSKMQSLINKEIHQTTGYKFL